MFWDKPIIILILHFDLSWKYTIIVVVVQEMLLHINLLYYKTEITFRIRIVESSVEFIQILHSACSDLFVQSSRLCAEIVRQILYDY